MPNKVNVVVKLRPRSKMEVALNIKEQWTVVGNSIRCSIKSYKFGKINDWTMYAPTFLKIILFTGRSHIQYYIQKL